MQGRNSLHRLREVILIEHRTLALIFVLAYRLVDYHEEFGRVLFSIDLLLIRQPYNRLTTCLLEFAIDTVAPI